MDRSVMTECYSDTLLIETLVPSKDGYNHQMGCLKVEAEMRFGSLKDRFAVGIIDNDKKQVKYLREFEVIDKVDDFLILWKHSNKLKHHYFIQICPALEKWILKVCEIEGLNIEGFGLSNDLELLKQYTKSRRRLKDDKLKRLFKTINSKSTLEAVTKLKKWIRILKEKNYKVEINELVNG